MVLAIAICGCTSSSSTDEPLYIVGIDGAYPPYFY